MDAVEQKVLGDEASATAEQVKEDEQGLETPVGEVVEPKEAVQSDAGEKESVDIDQLEAKELAEGEGDAESATDEEETADVDKAKEDAESETEEVVEAEPDDGREWYFIQTYSGYENKVKKLLDQRIEAMGMQNKMFRVVVPTEDQIEIRNGKRRTKKHRVFPGYVMIQMIIDDESWYVVHNTPSVVGFVGPDPRPLPVNQEEVDRILERMEEEEPRIKLDFRVGEIVRITDGPFANFTGLVDDLYPEQGKVRLLVSFFGRETPVEMDFLHVERT